MSLVFVAGLPELPNQLNTQHRLWPSHVTMEEQVHHTDQVSRNFCTYSAPNMTSSGVSIVWVRAVPTLPCFKFVPHPVQGVCMSIWAPLQKLIMGVTRSFHCTYIKCIVWLTKHGLCSSDGTIIFFSFRSSTTISICAFAQQHLSRYVIIIGMVSLCLQFW